MWSENEMDIQATDEYKALEIYLRKAQVSVVTNITLGMPGSRLVKIFGGLYNGVTFWNEKWPCYCSSNKAWMALKVFKIHLK